ncbi:MAG: hypothetical protein IJ809_05390 [Clostridia bacterium]|nr:hypothetical protein [Clostridia bacterium]
MKKATVIIIVILLALTIVAAIGLIPYAMSINSLKNATNAKSGEYELVYNNLINNNYISDSVKDDVRTMNTSFDTSINAALKSEFTIIMYLMAVISLILILVGVYVVKSPDGKNYIGTVFVVAGCILLAFVAIFGYYILKM